MRFSRFFPPAIALLLLSSSGNAYAQNPIAIITNLPGCDFVTGKLQASCIPVFVGHLIQTVFGLISVLFLINVIYAGYEIAIGGWSGEKEEGKNRLRYSIIGMIVSVCSFLILDRVISIIAP